MSLNRLGSLNRTSSYMSSVTIWNSPYLTVRSFHYLREWVDQETEKEFQIFMTELSEKSNECVTETVTECGTESVTECVSEYVRDCN